MSSFVIRKEEYLKAAGIVAGIAEFYNNTSKKIFIYDYQENRIMDSDLFYKRFVECFEMNTLNVYEYYKPRHKDEQLYFDNNKYEDVFQKYIIIGKKTCYYPDKLEKIVFDLRDFFQSAEYQTAENNAYFFKMQMLFNNILVELMKLLYPHECTCYGQFNIEE